MSKKAKQPKPSYIKVGVDLFSAMDIKTVSQFEKRDQINKAWEIMQDEIAKEEQSN